jgi:hypothetical protein
MWDNNCMDTTRNHHGSQYTATAPAPDSIPCPKCGGTGFFALGFVNETPQSNTGFDCYKCGGSGWVEGKPRRERKPKSAPVTRGEMCPRCRVWVSEPDKPHLRTLYTKQMNARHIPCETGNTIPAYLYEYDFNTHRLVAAK